MIDGSDARTTSNSIPGRGAGGRPTADATPEAPAPASPRRATPVRTEGAVGTERRVLERISREIGADRFRRYFANQARLTVEAGRADVVVPSDFLARFMGRNFRESLEKALAEENGAPIELNFLVDPSAFPGVSAEPAQASPPEAPAPARVPAPRPKAPRQTGPSTRYALEDFVVGDANRLAFASVQQLVESDAPHAPGPVFIHGSCGNGKTHLLQAAARRYLERRPGARVHSLTAESFTNEYIAAVQAKQLPAFRKKYRAADLLCIDDVQVFANKEATQREFQHTFDAAATGGARVLLASDGHPRDIQRLSAHLSSRFVAGAVVRIDGPDPAMRESLVRAFARRRGLLMDDAAVAVVARCATPSTPMGPSGPAVGGSVREVEGLVTQVEALARVAPDLLHEGRVGLNLVRKALGLGDAAGPIRPRRPIPPQVIAAEVCKWLGLDHAELVGRGRHKLVVFGREITVALCRRMTTLSYPEIARAFGKQTHSTVLTAHRRIQAQIDAGEPPEMPMAGGLAGMSVAQICDQIAAAIERACA